ncbi:MAG: EamA family transporter [Hyphomicrobiales bacterium]|nr:EamA family transporter [Hyphomicrobiales bacterium]
MADTVQQIAFKLTADDALPVEASLAYVTRLISEPSSLLIVATALAWLLIYTSLLRIAPVGPLFAAAHGYIVTVILASALIFGETISGFEIIGSILIVSGIVILALTEGGTPSKNMGT